MSKALPRMHAFPSKRSQLPRCECAFSICVPWYLGRIPICTASERVHVSRNPRCVSRAPVFSLHWRVPSLFLCWLNADGPPLFHAMLCEAIGSQVEENGYVFCLHEELSHLLTCGKNLLAPRAIGFYVESRKSVSLFFALI